MNFNLILKTSVSLLFELKNDTVYLAEKPYDVYLDDELLLAKQTTNVFGLYDLEPATSYRVKITLDGESFEQTSKTKKESAMLDVKQFGALGDGVHDDTLAIQTAIMSVPKNGRIVFNKGTYLSKPIFLRDDLTLELKEGAVLLGSTNRNDYSIIPGHVKSTDEKTEYHLNAWEGNPIETFASLITGMNVKNVTIVGKGTINGNASNSDWWVDHKRKRISWRPRLMFLNHCKNIVLNGITVTNSPSWNIHPFYTSNLDIIDLTIINPMDSPNTDGIDPESCDHVRIIGTHISVGDDCVVLKAGKLYLGTYFTKPISDVEIRNCFMENGHGAVVLGSEISSGAKNIQVSQCLFKDTDRGLRIKTRRGRGKTSVINDISFENILMDGVKAPITMNMHYRCDPDGDSEYVQTDDLIKKDDWTPYLGRFHFEKITCKNIHQSAVYCVGLPEEPIKEISIKDVSFEYAKDSLKGKPIMRTVMNPIANMGAYFRHVKKVSFDNVTFKGQSGDEVILEEVNSFERGEL